MIDIHELRIGSTVLYKGERLKVCVTAKFQNTDPRVGIRTDKGVRFNIIPQDLDPIPITEELLTELGFEKSIDKIIGVPIFAKTIGNDFHIEVKKFHVYDEWRLHVDDCDHDSVGFLDVHYLHEAEAFIYMTTKQELI